MYEYADNYCGIFHSIPEEILDYFQAHDLPYILRTEKCATPSQVMEMTLVYEDRRKHVTQVIDIGKSMVSARIVFVS